jgi:hypothetical protein
MRIERDEVQSGDANHFCSVRRKKAEDTGWRWSPSRTSTGNEQQALRLSQDTQRQG